MNNMLRWSGLYGVTLWMTGIAGAVYLLALLVNVRTSWQQRKLLVGSVLVASGLIVVALIILITELGSPLRFWHLLVYPRFYSPLSVGTWVLTGLLGVLAVTLLLKASPWLPMLSILGAIFASLTIVYPGIVLHATHRPLWYFTNLLPLIFTATSFATGAAVLIFIKLIIDRSLLSNIYYFSAFAAGAGFFLVILFVTTLRFSQATVANRAYAHLMSGGSGILFMSAVSMGMIIPMISVWIMRKRPNLPVILGTEGLILIGALLLRLSFIYGGQV